MARLTDQVVHLRAGRIVAAPDSANLPDLAGLAPEQVERLALAALRAGLDPKP